MALCANKNSVSEIKEKQINVFQKMLFCSLFSFKNMACMGSGSQHDVGHRTKNLVFAECYDLCPTLCSDPSRYLLMFYNTWQNKKFE